MDDTNARLRRQLLELKADEQELAQRNKELTATNRRLTNAQKSFDSLEKSNYAKIRDLELGRSTIQRRANNILAENNTLSAENKKLKAFGDKLQRENDALKQKIAGIDIDLDSSRTRLSDTEALLKSKDAQVKGSLENNEIKLKEDINGLKNEVARLAGVEDLLKDRNSNLTDENELAKDRYREIEVENEALLAEVEALRNLSNEFKFESTRKGEQIANLQALNNDLKSDLGELIARNNDFKLSESAMKGELSLPRSELTSLGLEESRISEQLLGLRDANEMLLSKTKNLESENNGMEEAIDLMKVELRT